MTPKIEDASDSCSSSDQNEDQADALGHKASALHVDFGSNPYLSSQKLKATNPNNDTRNSFLPNGKYICGRSTLMKKFGVPELVFLGK